MTSGLQTENSAGRQGKFRNRLKEWLFLEGNRLIVAIGIVAVFVVALGGLVWTGMVAVGADSSVASVFASGIISGVVTLVTIAVSINQLVLSRVFGSPGKLSDRLRRLRPPSRKFSCANFGKITMLKPLFFWLMALNTSKLHCNELTSDFIYIATEIGTLSNGFFES